MVAQFFKLREQPFGVTPDPRYLYPSASHREALASLLYGLQSGLGFVTLIAKPGMGKTTLLSEVLKRLGETRTTVFLFQTTATSVDLLRSILIDLGIRDVPDNLVDLQTQMNKALLSQCATGKPVVLVIDEAQNLSDAVLETVRMLSNFETAKQKLMQIVLTGQPQLAEKLLSPDMLQLRQRISIFAHLAPLSMIETAAYIRHRLSHAGLEAGKSIFTPSAIALIARHSEGIPRNINNLCFNAMSLAVALKQSSIDIEIVNEVIADLNVAERLLSADSYSGVEDESQLSAFLACENCTSDDEQSSELPPGELAEPQLHLIPELHSSAVQQFARNRDSEESGNFYTPEQVQEVSSVIALSPVHDCFITPSGISLDAKVAFEDTLSTASSSIAPSTNVLNRFVRDRSESQVNEEGSEHQVSERSSYLGEPILNDAGTRSSTLMFKETTSDKAAPGLEPISAEIQSRPTWRAKYKGWNHTAIIAVIACSAICAWLAVVDYHIIFPPGGSQPNSEVLATSAHPNSGQTTDNVEPTPGASAPHKASVRVKKTESLAKLCNSLYGRCTPEMLDELLVLNPSVLYPNRLYPGQVIAIPLDAYHAKTER